MVKYIGSKRLLVPLIVRVIRSLPEARSVVDFFSGTSRVGHALKGAGFRVVANDVLTYAHQIATCYVQADRERVIERAERVIAELEALPGSPGYVTETFCREARFFQPSNGERIDAIRERIEAMGLEPELRAVAITSLLEAADRVDSTTGVQMAYVKSWSARSRNRLSLRVPRVLPGVRAGRCEAHQLEAQEAARRLSGDVAYIDPPYNQHSYLGNYHVWETIARWDKPEAYGVARKRVDCRERKSDFNSRRRAEGALERFLANVDARWVVASFSDEGFISRERMEELLSARGRVHVISRSHPRYVGARIGIHNPRGERVGEVSHLRNTEHVYVVTPRGAGWELGEGVFAGVS